MDLFFFTFTIFILACKMSDETVAMLAPGLGLPNLTSLDLRGASILSFLIPKVAVIVAIIKGSVLTQREKSHLLLMRFKDVQSILDS
jgi:hypothetical protein